MTGGNTGKIGDIIAIPVQDGQFATAQILKKTKLLYLAVFSGLQEDLLDCNGIAEKSITLVGWTMDAKLYHGDWKIVGNCDLKEPNMLRRDYLIEYSGDQWVQDFDGNLVRIASDEDKRRLFPKSSYSPVRLERAIRAFNNIEPWSDDYNDLLITE